MVIAEQSARLAGCSDLNGSLIIGPSLTLEAFTELDGPGSIAGDLEVAGNPLLGGLFSSTLTRVEGSVVVDGNHSLTTVSLHALEHIGGDLLVTDNGSVIRVDLSALTTVGGRLEVSGNPLLEELALPGLEMRDVQIKDNPALRRQPSRRGDPVSDPG